VLATEPSSLEPVSRARTAIFALARLITAIAMYPWFMGRFADFARFLDLPIHYQIEGQGSSCLGALAVLILIVVGFERRRLADVGFRRNGALRDFCLGSFAGATMFTTIIAFSALAGWYRLEEPPLVSQVLLIQARLALMFLFAAAAEEIMFRGLVFRIIEDALGSWAALLLSGAYFAFLHGNNPSISALGLIGILLAGFFFAMVYVATRSLWVVIGIHWAWNFFEGPVFGAPVSGYQLDSLMTATIDGPTLWTGGDFGPEAGLPILILLTLLTAITFVLAKRTGKLQPLRQRPLPPASLPPEEAPIPQNEPVRPSTARQWPEDTQT